jgi:hypothetical protein
MQINPGLADKDTWRTAAYKGGSEPGVFSMTHYLIALDGTRWCVTASWNYETAGEGLVAPVLGIIASLVSR